jgi:hypothetical protein
MLHGRPRSANWDRLWGASASTRWAIADPFPGGRPLRRRRENGVDFGAPRLRETVARTVALQILTDHRC